MVEAVQKLELFGSGAETNDVEAALVARCRRQDSAAYDLIVREYSDRVYNYVRRMVNHPQDAEDLAQETFVRALTSISRFDGRSRISTWLFRIATNLCIDYHRAKKRKPDAAPLVWEEDEREHEYADEKPGPVEQLLEREMADLVDCAIQQLSPKLRTTLLLVDVEGLSYEEVATATRTPVGTVKSRLFMARNAVKKQLEGYRGV